MFLKISLCALLMFSNCNGMGMIRRTVSKVTDTVKSMVTNPNPLDVNEDYSVGRFSLHSISEQIKTGSQIVCNVASETWQVCKTQGQRLGSAIYRMNISWISSKLSDVYLEYRLNRLQAEIATLHEALEEDRRAMGLYQ